MNNNNKNVGQHKSDEVERGTTCDLDGDTFDLNKCKEVTHLRGKVIISHCFLCLCSASFSWFDPAAICHEAE